MTSHEAMLALSTSVADLPPDDARHAAADAAIDVLKPAWQDQMKQAWSTPAIGSAGLHDKAALLDSLIDREDDGSCWGNPLLSLAASLAEDVLRQQASAPT